MRLFTTTVVLLIAVAPVTGAAWTRQGHMMTAQIAYEQLLLVAPDVIDAASTLLDSHPDRGAFEVAAGRTVGRERARRLFLECSRWPDDARKTAYDHPTWHASALPIIDVKLPPPVAPAADVPAFEALQAFDLNFRTLRDPIASPADRAVALCWVMHLAGDIHQPLHAAQLFSSRFPQGDLLGSNQFVTDPKAGKIVSLHWYWDDSANSSDDQGEIARKATQWMERFPRVTLPELRTPARAADFGLWATQESYPLAMQYVYGLANQAFGTTSTEAPSMTQEHARKIEDVAQRRVVVAGYRIADLLQDAFRMNKEQP